MTVSELYDKINRHHPLKIVDSKTANVLRWSYDPQRDENMQRLNIGNREIVDIYPILDVTEGEHHNANVQAKIVCEI